MLLAAILWILLTVSGAAGQIPRAAADDFQQAVGHFRAGRYPAALAILTRLESRFPENAEIEHLLAIVLDLNQQPEQANQRFRKAVELSPASAALRTNYGASLMRLGRPAEAAVQFRRALQLEPENGTACFNLGTILLRRGELEEARTWLEKAYRAQPAVYENAYQLAYCHFLLKDHEAARRVLDGMQGVPSQGAEFHLLRALNERALGRTKSAGEELTQMLSRLTEEPETLERVSLLLLSQGMYAEAIPLLEQIAARLQSNDSAWMQLARARLTIGQLEEAGRDTSRALQLRESAQAHALLGDILEAQQKSIEALEHYRKAAELEPSEENLYALGHEFLIHWNWEVAQQVFQRALSVHPRSWRLWVGLGVAALGQESNDEAARAFLEAIEIAPDNLVLYHLLSESLVEADEEFDRVVACFEEFFSRSPDEPWADYYEALAGFRRAERSGEIRHLEVKVERLRDLVRTIPDFFEAHLLLGELYFNLERWSEAVSALQRALELDPEHVQGHYWLGLALQRTGRAEQAREVLKQYQALKAKQTEAVSRRVAQTTRFIVELKNNAKTGKP